MKKTFFIFLLSLLTTVAFAQDIVSGSVKDAVTGDPLEGVGVIVSTGDGALTDANGNFSVNDAYRQFPLAFLLHTADMASTIKF